MKAEKMASRLHENERKILLALKDRGTATMEELSQLTGLGKDTLERACAWAETKGIITLHRRGRRSSRS